MNTFLPYPDFKDSAKCLDMRRLGKQRVECLQILKGSWPNHPVSKMWKDYRSCLCAYAVEMCSEWIARGYKDTCLEKCVSIISPSVDIIPIWIGDKNFHAAMRSNLLRKNKEWYSQFGWVEPDNLPYVWFV